MKRKEDPKREKAHANRVRAEVWLQILRNGIGDVLKTGFRTDEDLRPILEFANSELLKAADASEEAEKAYEPYWRRRRTVVRPRRAYRAPKKKT